MNEQSPFSNTRILDIKKMDNDDVKNVQKLNEWYCCFFQKPTDSRLLKFLLQYIILLAVFIFCLAQLWRADNCESTTTYISLLTFLLGLIIPSGH